MHAVIILCDDSTGCDEKGVYLDTEADTMIYIVCEIDLIKISFGTFNKMSRLHVKLLFYICSSTCIF